MTRGHVAQFLTVASVVSLLLYAFSDRAWFLLPGLALPALTLLVVHDVKQQRKPASKTGSRFAAQSHKIVAGGQLVPKGGTPPAVVRRDPRRPQPTANVRRLQARLAAATEFADIHGYGTELRQVLGNVDAAMEQREAG